MLQSMTLKWTDEVYHIHEVEIGVALDVPSAINYYAVEARPLIEQAFQNCLTNGTEWEIDLPLISAKGKNIWVRSNGKAEFKDGKPVRVYGALQEITERKKDEKERIKMIDTLMVKNKDLEEFTYIVSHNLRAPLANIKGLTSLMESEDLDDKTKKELMAYISLSVHRLDEVVYDFNHILQLKRANNISKERVRLSKLVNEICEGLNGNLEKEGIKLITDFTSVDELFTINSCLHTIFSNLISNSIKFRKQNLEAVITIRSEKKDNKTTLIFTDNGIGINLKIHGSKMFTLYHRCHSEIEGKGMGLYIVKSQVDTLGGKISIDSAVNEGTEFTVEFENDLTAVG